MHWFEEKPQRYLAETELIKRCFPQARIFREKNRIVVFHMIIGMKTRYLVRMEYPEDFPYEQPRAFIVEPKINKAEHRWMDGALCLHGNSDDSRITGKIVLDRTKQWIMAYEEWVDSGNWPELHEL